MTAAVSVRGRIAGLARAEPGRAALVGFGADLAEQVLSWREFTDQVPRSAAGKIQRWRLAPFEQDGAAPP